MGKHSIPEIPLDKEYYDWYAEASITHDASILPPAMLGLRNMITVIPSARPRPDIPDSFEGWSNLPVTLDM